MSNGESINQTPGNLNCLPLYMRQDPFFVGRNDEHEAIMATLADPVGTHTAMLNGPEGIGKTELATEIALAQVTAGGQNSIYHNVLYLNLADDLQPQLQFVADITESRFNMTLQERLATAGPSLVIIDGYNSDTNPDTSIPVELRTASETLHMLKVGRGLPNPTVELGPLSPEDAERLFYMRSGTIAVRHDQPINTVDSTYREAVARILATLNERLGTGTEWIIQAASYVSSTRSSNRICFFPKRQCPMEEMDLEAKPRLNRGPYKTSFMGWYDEQT